MKRRETSSSRGAGPGDEGQVFMKFPGGLQWGTAQERAVGEEAGLERAKRASSVRGNFLFGGNGEPRKACERGSDMSRSGFTVILQAAGKGIDL